MEHTIYTYCEQNLEEKMFMSIYLYNMYTEKCI